MTVSAHIIENWSARISAQLLCELSASVAQFDWGDAEFEEIAQNIERRVLAPANSLSVVLPRSIEIRSLHDLSNDMAVVINFLHLSPNEPGFVDRILSISQIASVLSSAKAPFGARGHIVPVGLYLAAKYHCKTFAVEDFARFVDHSFDHLKAGIHPKVAERTSISVGSVNQKILDWLRASSLSDEWDGSSKESVQQFHRAARHNADLVFMDQLSMAA